jgi:hypothetical protein
LEVEYFAISVRENNNMNTRTVGIILLLMGAVLLLVSGAGWPGYVGGMVFILGFLVFSLDLMRRSIERRG